VEAAFLELDHARVQQALDRGPALGAQLTVASGHPAAVRWRPGPRPAFLSSGDPRAAASLVSHVKRLAVRFMPRWHSGQVTLTNPPHLRRTDALIRFRRFL
jgi:hypothetical protein